MAHHDTHIKHHCAADPRRRHRRVDSQHLHVAGIGTLPLLRALDHCSVGKINIPTYTGFRNLISRLRKNSILTWQVRNVIIDQVNEPGRLFLIVGRWCESFCPYTTQQTTIHCSSTKHSVLCPVTPPQSPLLPSPHSKWISCCLNLQHRQDEHSCQSASQTDKHADTIRCTWVHPMGFKMPIHTHFLAGNLTRKYVRLN